MRNHKIPYTPNVKSHPVEVAQDSFLEEKPSIPQGEGQSYSNKNSSADGPEATDCVGIVGDTIEGTDR